MRYIYLLFIVLFYSCSPKVVTITKTRIDTLYKDSISFITEIKECQIDTSFNLKGHGDVSIKIDSNKLYFDFKPEKQIIDQTVIEIPKDIIKQDRRLDSKDKKQEEKTEREAIKQEEKTNRTNIRQSEKTDRTELRSENKTGFFNWLKKLWNNVIYIGIGFVIGYIISKFKFL